MPEEAKFSTPIEIRPYYSVGEFLVSSGEPKLCPSEDLTPLLYNDINDYILWVNFRHNKSLNYLSVGKKIIKDIKEGIPVKMPKPIRVTLAFLFVGFYERMLEDLLW